MINLKNLILVMLLCSLTVNSDQDLSQSLNTKLLKIYSDLLLDLEACVDDEGLNGIDRHQTKCNVDNLHPFQNIFYQTQYKHASLYLDGFKYPGQAIKSVQPKYPGDKPSGSGIFIDDYRNGVVVIVFSIDKEGKTFNHQVFSSTFTFTKREPGSEFFGKDKFSQAALKAALELKYEPATYRGSPLVLNGIKFRYRFALNENEIATGRGGVVELNNINKLIKKGKLQKAKEKSLEKIDDYHYMNLQLAKIFFLEKNYPQAQKYAYDFLYDNWSIIEGQQNKFRLLGLSILTESFFKQNKYKEIIDNYKLIKNFNLQKEYKNDLAQVNMFLGLSYLFEGDLIKGIEHLLIAKRSTENLKVIEIIDLYLNEADKAI